MQLDRPDFFPFEEAQNDTLQVLLGEFELERKGEGSQLTVAFGDTTPSIRRRQSRSLLRRLMEVESESFRDDRTAIQQRIDDVLLHHAEPAYKHRDDGFLFRYCSGGTLPVLSLEGETYYCFFLRDIAPFGWNIANGSTDTLPELLDPSITIRRELREELIALDVRSRVDYTFVWDTESAIHRPEFDDARQMIAALEGFRGISEFAKTPQVVRTCDGFDSVDATFCGTSGEPIRALKPVRGCFLNINTEDFGIEVDRVGLIELPCDVSLLDGEINANRLLNRPIGLFKVQDFDPDHPPSPDRVFHSGKESSLEEAILGFTDHVLGQRIRQEDQVRAWKELDPDDRFGLCPVTRQIVRRHQRALAERQPGYVHEQSMLAFMLDTCARARQVFRHKPFVDYGIDGEIEWVRNDGSFSGRRISVQLKSGKTQLRTRSDGTVVFYIKNERHIPYWRDHDSDVFLVVRTHADAPVRWMNISQALRAEPTNTVVFTGEELDPHALLRARDLYLSGA
jgi:hypothetical protein